MSIRSHINIAIVTVFCHETIAEVEFTILCDINKLDSSTCKCHSGIAGDSLEVNKNLTGHMMLCERYVVLCSTDSFI